ncbi:hypothetical protein C1N76_11125 [Geobacillus thermoleovorans]|uniref:Uncharacterized protein n=1 Tax=Geobacillus thermoleovorans TaxID=33941 RepID=A0A2Z3NBA7_GEOTH|nr:hypothetical protein C1N76_11125 [Geobacillus thermoleovorans]TLS34513.1 hypothetical protein FDK15_02015 [Geobacillus thermoleovorans]
MVKNENGLQIDGISSEKKADSAAFLELKDSRNQPYFALNHQPSRTCRPCSSSFFKKSLVSPPYDLC